MLTQIAYTRSIEYRGFDRLKCWAEFLPNGKYNQFDCKTSTVSGSPSGSTWLVVLVTLCHRAKRRRGSLLCPVACHASDNLVHSPILNRWEARDRSPVPVTGQPWPQTPSLRISCIPLRHLNEGWKWRNKTDSTAVIEIVGKVFGLLRPSPPVPPSVFLSGRLRTEIPPTVSSETR